MSTSFFRIRFFTARYAPRTLYRFLFYSTSSLRFTYFREITTPYGTYHAEAPYIIVRRIIEIYISRAILKFIFYIDVEMRLIIGD
jgi:hypothetical protein